MSSLNDLYNRLPAPLQNLAVTAYGYRVYRREYGKKFEQQLAQFEMQAKFSPEEIKAYQSEKLQPIIKHAYQTVPYYREVMDRLRLTPADFRTVDDVPKMPVLTKEDVIENFDKLVSTAIKPSKMISGSTSGTTGRPMFLRYDHNSCLIKTVAEWRMKRSLGVDVGEKFAFFTGRMFVPPHRTKPPFWRKNMILNHLFFSCFHMSQKNMQVYLDQLYRFNPVVVEGYPSSLFVVARYMVEKGITYPARMTFTSSETLYPVQREMIEKAFPCPLYDFYGAAERIIFGSECVKQVGKHLNLDFGFTEIIDSNQQLSPPGEMGQMVATGFHNFAMPLIRYRTDDASSIRHEPCECGCTFPFMSDVTSKSEDIITTPDGRHIVPASLTHPFKPLKGVLESQIIQEELRFMTVKLVVNNQFNDDERNSIIRELSARVGADMKIEIQIVDAIPRTQSGKLRWVISKVGVEF